MLLFLIPSCPSTCSSFNLELCATSQPVLGFCEFENSVVLQAGTRHNSCSSSPYLFLDISLACSFTAQITHLFFQQYHRIAYVWQATLPALVLTEVGLDLILHLFENLFGDLFLYIHISFYHEC